MSKKLIVKVFLHDERTARKAIKSISRLKGVESTSMNMKDKKLTLIGDMDPVEVVKNLRKVCSAEILSVGPAKEEKKEEEEPEKEKSKKRKEKEEPKKEEPKKDKEEAKKDEAQTDDDDDDDDDVARLVKAYQAYNPYLAPSREFARSAEDTNACAIC
ncbi:heavy metal-associated isoprenylated plant protein 39-like [Corylus avellana]|uniref:heavy metal-associated isoprenylated plant protein 39-like n=1 Tax=Corylus avellana TaxID=13451 RepID=UPI00286C99D5|nr:heavy metal-associated isoprenylated plant protein 39-like [Corylus avellana]XP_059440479.1 heavy metal-associated isoprenylated plant protein 39-like [Corylus avellana]